MLPNLALARPKNSLRRTTTASEGVSIKIPMLSTMISSQRLITRLNGDQFNDFYALMRCASGAKERGHILNLTTLNFA
jgi:hypothetical protein